MAQKQREIKYMMTFLNYNLKMDIRILRPTPKQRDVAYTLIVKIIYNTCIWSKIPVEGKSKEEINS